MEGRTIWAMDPSCESKRQNVSQRFFSPGDFLKSNSCVCVCYAHIMGGKVATVVYHLSRERYIYTDGGKGFSIQNNALFVYKERRYRYDDTRKSISESSPRGDELMTLHVCIYMYMYI